VDLFFFLSSLDRRLAAVNHFMWGSFHAGKNSRARQVTPCACIQIDLVVSSLFFPVSKLQFSPISLANLTTELIVHGVQNTAGLTAFSGLMAEALARFWELWLAVANYGYASAISGYTASQGRLARWPLASAS
jgi:hypothetical protein